MIKIKCPYCKNPIDVEKRFFNTTKKVCCMSCNKAFDIVQLREEYEEESAYERMNNEAGKIDDDTF